MMDITRPLMLKNGHRLTNVRECSWNKDKFVADVPTADSGQTGRVFYKLDGRSAFNTGDAVYADRLDITKPIEAVNKLTGDVVPLTYKGPSFNDRGFYTNESPCPATSNNAWHDDGEDYCAYKRWFIRNVAPAIDTSKPLQLSNGTPVAFAGMARTGDIRVRVPGSHRWGGGLRHFRKDGTYAMSNLYLKGLTLQNVPTPAAGSVNFAKPIQRRDGAPAEYLGALNGNHLVRVKPVGIGVTPFIVEVDSNGHEQTQRTTRYGTKLVSNNDIVNKVVDTVTFRNVYADGTIGSTIHVTLDNAQARAKVGKTRIGILETFFENGTPTHSRYHACVPTVRTSGYESSRFPAPSAYPLVRASVAEQNA